MSTFKNEFQFDSFKTKPTILQVIPALGSGGVEIETIEIGRAVASAGGRSLVVADLSQGGEDSLPPEIKFINLPLNTKNPFQISKNSRLLKDLITKEGVDLVHVRSRAPAWSAYKAARSLGVPFVATHHATYRSRSVLKTFYNSVMVRGDRVIAISQFMADHIMKTYKKAPWFDPSKVQLIHRGVDCHFFDPSAISQERLVHLKKNWGLKPGGGRLILLPGRISRNKGQDVLIKALSLMNHADATIVLVGSAQGHENLRDSLLKQAASLDLEGRVKWMPPCPDLPAAFQLADVIVCPSLVPEGFGRVIAEALSMKKPIVASNIGAPIELIEEGKTGWLTPPGDDVALAKALDHALDLSEKQLKKIGELGRKRALSDFSKETMCSETIALYVDVLKGWGFGASSHRRG